MRVLRLLLLSVPVLLAAAAVAVERGNAEAGRALVSRSCITCHATSGTTTQSDVAPPFSFLARDNKYRTAFVRGWLMDPHPPMPSIMLSRQQISDIVAYLETLPVASGDARAGEQFAKVVCAQCHGVGKGQDRSPNRAAPSFADIAASPGLTATAIRVWLQTPHPTMPNVKLNDEEKDNVVAYLLSLKTG